MKTLAPVSPRTALTPGMTLLPPTAAPVVAPLRAGRLADGWTFEVFDRVDSLPPGLWDDLFPAGWKDARYYRTLEETFSNQFPQRYLVVYEGGEVRAVQPCFFVEQDLTVSLSERVRSLLRPLRRLLRMRLLMVGCIVGEAQTGVAGGNQLPARWAIQLAAAIEQFARAEGISIVLFKDVPLDRRDSLRTLTENGRYTRLASLPGVRLPLDFASFDDYVQNRLGKATRKSLRRKFREVEALAEPIRLEIKHSISEAEATLLHALYQRVALRGEVHFEVFTREYFLQLGHRMPEHARFFIWRHEGRIVAFAFCTVSGNSIYDNDIGIDETAPSSLNLYHITFRDIIRWALAQGLENYYSAPFNYDPKLHLRMELVPFDLYAHHRWPIANFLLRHFARFADPTRQEPLLRSFPNAALIH